MKTIFNKDLSGMDVNRIHIQDGLARMSLLNPSAKCKCKRYQYVFTAKGATLLNRKLYWYVRDDSNPDSLHEKVTDKRMDLYELRDWLVANGATYRFDPFGLGVEDD